MVILKVLAGAAGRAPRRWYWGVILTNIVAGLLFSRLAVGEGWGWPTWAIWSGISIYVTLLMSAWRCRDMGIPAVVSLMTLIPMLGLGVMFYLGIGEPDRDGATPTPRRTGA